MVVVLHNYCIAGLVDVVVCCVLNHLMHGPRVKSSAPIVQPEKSNWRRPQGQRAGQAFNYLWVCKHFPNGGGYTAAGLPSRRLATIGGLLLLAYSIVTATLSCLDGFHYLGAANPANTKSLWLLSGMRIQTACRRHR